MSKYSELPLWLRITMCLKFFIIYFIIITSVNLWVDYHGKLLYELPANSDDASQHLHKGVVHSFSKYPIRDHLLFSSKTTKYISHYNQLVPQEDTLVILQYLKDMGVAMVGGYADRDFWIIKTDFFLNPLLYNVFLILFLINRLIRKIYTFSFYKKEVEKNDVIEENDNKSNTNLEEAFTYTEEHPIDIKKSDDRTPLNRKPGIITEATENKTLTKEEIPVVPSRNINAEMKKKPSIEDMYDNDD